MDHEILRRPLAELTDIAFNCACGHDHSIQIGTLTVGPGASKRVAEAAKPYQARRILLVADVHTFDVLGERVLAQLKDAGLAADAYVFPEEHLHPDASAVGRLFIEASDEKADYGLLIAVGSGVLNDITRLVSGRLGLPYFIVCTAPSMDGYAGSSSPIVCRGTKLSFYSHYADAIIADTDVMSRAPREMIAAGFGDVLGKYTALADWELGERERGEYRCALISDFMRGALETCAASAEGVAARDPAAVGRLTEALILSGMAMGLAGVTRPASGCEHHIAHYCDIDAVANGRDYPLHGATVGVAELAMLRFYEFARRDGLTDIETPAADAVRKLLLAVGAPVRPAEIGISTELFRRAILEAMHLRPQYSMLKHVAAAGKLDEYTDAVIKELCD